MIINLYYSICGYAEVEVSGGLAERFVNGCTVEGIFIWNVKKCGDVLRLSVLGKAAEKLPIIAEKSGCRVEILRYRGLKYFASRFKKRYALMVGFLFFFAILFAAGSVVWKIEISGCKSVERDEILKVLEDNNVKKMSLKKNIDTKKLASRIAGGIRGVSWAGAELKGTVLKIKIKERREVPYMVDEVPHDLVAKRDGVIIEMRVRNGEKLKNIGDKVMCGEVIVSALVERDGENELPIPYTVHSFGEVIAKTWYEFDVEQPLFDEKISYSGAKMSRKRIKISKIPINLYFRGSILYAEYDKIVKSKGSLVKYENEIVFEKKTERQKLTVDEAVEDAVYAASKKLPSQIMSAKCVGSDYTFGNGCLNVHVIFECTENIAVEQRYTERREDINDSYNK